MQKNEEYQGIIQPPFKKRDELNAELKKPDKTEEEKIIIREQLKQLQDHYNAEIKPKIIIMEHEKRTFIAQIKRLERDLESCTNRKSQLEALRQICLPEPRDTLIKTSPAIFATFDQDQKKIQALSKDDKGEFKNPIDHLQHFIKAPDVLMALVQKHDLIPQMTHELDAMSLKTQGGKYTFRVYKDCLMEPDNIAEGDRERVYKVMVDFLLASSKGKRCR